MFGMENGVRYRAYRGCYRTRGCAEAEPARSVWLLDPRGWPKPCVWGLEFRDADLFRVWGYGLRFRVWSLGCAGEGVQRPHLPCL